MLFGLDDRPQCKGGDGNPSLHIEYAGTERTITLEPKWPGSQSSDRPDRVQVPDDQQLLLFLRRGWIGRAGLAGPGRRHRVFPKAYSSPNGAAIASVAQNVYRGAGAREPFPQVLCQSQRRLRYSRHRFLLDQRANEVE